MSVLVCSLCVAGALGLSGPDWRPPPSHALQSHRGPTARPEAPEGRGGEILAGAGMVVLGDILALGALAGSISVSGGLYGGENEDAATVLAVGSLATVGLLAPLFATLGVSWVARSHGYAGDFGRAYTRALVTNLLLAGVALGAMVLGAAPLGVLVLAAHVVGLPLAASAGWHSPQAAREQRSEPGRWSGRGASAHPGGVSLSLGF